MSARAVIDSLEFARTGQTLRGSLSVPGLTRLRDDLADTVGRVEFVIQGACDTRRRPILLLEIGGLLNLRCQRCLGPLEFPLQLSNMLLLVGAGESAADELDEEEPECIEASAELDVAMLIEDEIILGLPYAPRHPEGRCQAGASLAAVGAGGSKFAKLATLKRNSH